MNRTPFCNKIIWLALALFLLVFSGCAGNRAGTDLNTEGSRPAAQKVVRDSLRAKFVLSMAGEDGKMQDLDAVLFSVPGERYRMELTGPMGIGVASLLWTREEWNMVFPTEKMYLHGNGYMVGLLGDTTIPMVPIHQVADLFDGILIPQNSEIVAQNDSAGYKVVSAKAPNGMSFTYGEKDGQVCWFSRGGMNGKPETLKFSDFRSFENRVLPENIVFERDGKVFLKIRIKKVNHGKPFSGGTWRLNIPRSFKAVGS